jgi:lipoprotein signal peptidase
MTLTLLGGIALALASDQATKAFVRARVPEERGWIVVSWLRIRRLTHLTRTPDPWLLAAVAVGVLALDTFTPLLNATLTQLGVGIALGGAAGNVLDRVRRDGILDFIDLRVWPVFNVADAAIVLGTSIALWSLCPATVVARACGAT